MFPRLQEKKCGSGSTHKSSAPTVNKYYWLYKNIVQYTMKMNIFKPFSFSLAKKMEPKPTQKFGSGSR